MKTIEILFTPADFAALQRRNLDNSVCVVFDIFRATTSMITALANGAEAIIPVSEISEAMTAQKQNPQSLLAGERDGLRIRAELTGGTDFDLGNSPREFTKEKVAGKIIITTTTNGTRALRACAHAKQILIGSFLNLQTTADLILKNAPEELLLICSGTYEETAYEDILGAGAVCDLLWKTYAANEISDSARMTHEIYKAAQTNLLETASQSRNGRRLLNIPELRDDVAFSLQRDIYKFAATLLSDGKVKKV
jgi:2-phosphosulfolactate phosphatase